MLPNKGNFEAIKELLKAGADKTLKNYRDGGRLATDYAREQGHMDIVALLEDNRLSLSDRVYTFFKKWTGMLFSFFR